MKKVGALLVIVSISLTGLGAEVTPSQLDKCEHLLGTYKTCSQMIGNNSETILPIFFEVKKAGASYEFNAGFKFDRNTPITVQQFKQTDGIIKEDDHDYLGEVYRISRFICKNGILSHVSKAWSRYNKDGSREPLDKELLQGFGEKSIITTQKTANGLEIIFNPHNKDLTRRYTCK